MVADTLKNRGNIENAALIAFSSVFILSPALLTATGGAAPSAPATPPPTPDAKQSWSGTWNNQKFKTTGPLTCTVIGEQNGQWIARFSGTGLGRPFNYTALITVKEGKAGKALQGTSKVEGDTYQWTGFINDQGMSGSFRSGSGNNGSFQLQTRK